MFNVLLNQPLLNILIFLHNFLFNNLGLAIIVLTVIIRLILIPVTVPQMKSARRIQEINPELEKLKKKYKDDRQKLAQAQIELYKKYGINPASGCLPSILQFILLISLFQVFNQVIRTGESLEAIKNQLYSFISPPSSLNFNFLYLDLTKPDLIKISNFVQIPGLFVILSTVFQFLSSKLMSPAVNKIEREAKKTEEKTDDMAVAMQKQMLYLFPIMTLFFGYTMPSGVILYWFTFSLFSFLQQIILNKSQKGKVL